MLCKIWNFLLMMFKDTLDAVAYALKTVGEVLVDVAKGVGEAVGSVVSSVFGGSNLLTWAVLGVGAYFLFFKREDGKSNYTDTINRQRPSNEVINEKLV